MGWGEGTQQRAWLGLTPATATLLWATQHGSPKIRASPSSPPLLYSPKPSSPAPKRPLQCPESKSDVNLSRDPLSCPWPLLGNQKTITKMCHSHVTPQPEGFTILSSRIQSKCPSTAVTVYGGGGRLWGSLLQAHFATFPPTPPMPFPKCPFIPNSTLCG